MREDSKAPKPSKQLAVVEHVGEVLDRARAARHTGQLIIFINLNNGSVSDSYVTDVSRRTKIA